MIRPCTVSVPGDLVVMLQPDPLWRDLVNLDATPPAELDLPKIDTDLQDSPLI